MSGVKGINAGEKNWHYKHGMTDTRLFKIWEGMLDRCNRPTHRYFNDYGGRGISVCDEWKEFVPFYEWAVASGYSDGLSLDRKDNNKGYSPDNCRWATMKEQQNNKRSNRKVSYRGDSYTVTQLAEIAGLKKTTLKERLNAGWTVEDAVNKPVRFRMCGYRPSNCGAKMDGGET
jgi:hypothetical protein